MGWQEDELNESTNYTINDDDLFTVIGDAVYVFDADEFELDQDYDMNEDSWWLDAAYEDQFGDLVDEWQGEPENWDTDEADILAGTVDGEFDDYDNYTGPTFTEYED